MTRYDIQIFDIDIYTNWHGYLFCGLLGSKMSDKQNSFSISPIYMLLQLSWAGVYACGLVTTYILYHKHIIYNCVCDYIDPCEARLNIRNEINAL